MYKRLYEEEHKHRSSYLPSPDRATGCLYDDAIDKNAPCSSRSPLEKTLHIYFTFDIYSIVVQALYFYFTEGRIIFPQES